MKHIPLFLVLTALVTSAQAAQQEDPVITAKWRKHYTEHLPDAKKMLEACVVRGFSKVQGEELIKCNAARDAWHFQPYKPTGGKRFSSGGGRD